MDCELIAPPHSLTTAMFCANPTPSQTTSIWDFTVYIKQKIRGE
jgi:hypothetical protein